MLNHTDIFINLIASGKGNFVWYVKIEYKEAGVFCVAITFLKQNIFE